MDVIHLVLTFWQTMTVWKRGQVMSISPPRPECWNQTCGLAHWSLVEGSQCPPPRHPQQCGDSRRSHSHFGQMQRGRIRVYYTETDILQKCWFKFTWVLVLVPRWCTASIWARWGRGHGRWRWSPLSLDVLSPEPSALRGRRRSFL